MKLLIDIADIDKELLDKGLCGDARTEAVLFAVMDGIPISESTDLISREDVKARYKESFMDSLVDEERNIDFSEYAEMPCKRFNDFIDSIPSAVPEREKGEWIPVTKRLPKDDENVLVYCGQYSGRGVMSIAYYHSDYTFYPSECADLNETGWYDENDDAMYHEPIAWMPLPEHYKEGGDT